MSELIFVYKLILVLYNYDSQKVKIKCIEFFSDNPYRKAYRDFPSKNGSNLDEVELNIVLHNVGGDKKVLSWIKKYGNKFLSTTNDDLVRGQKDYICGLRDIYSEDYCDLAGDEIDNNVIEDFEKEAKRVCKTIDGNKVSIYYSVMELEAWYLSMPKILLKLGMEEEAINSVLECDLSKIDPEKYFIKPKNQLEKIHSRLLGKNYRETHFAEKFGEKMNKDVINDVLDSEKVLRFRTFINFLKNLNEI